MGKKPKSMTVARAEGRSSAEAGQARNKNPYPHSVPADRHEWFKGYDETMNKLADGKHKRS